MKRSIYIFFLANAISVIGNNLTLIAVPWFVLETTHSAAKMGFVGFATALPAVIATFFGGTLVDRFGHKRMSIIADLASGLTVALIPLLYHTIGLAFWQLLMLVFLSALLDAPGNTARHALLPDIANLAGMRLERANALEQMVNRGALLIAPMVASLLIIKVGSSQVLWLDAASFFISALLFAISMPASRPMAVASQNYFRELMAGLQYVRQDRLILTIILMVAITNFLDAPLFAVVLPVYAKQTFGQVTDLGLMLTTFGAGAVSGTLIFASQGHRLPRRLTFITTFIIIGLSFTLLSMTVSLAIALALLFLEGLMAGPINPIIMTVAQERIPPEMRGRVFGMMTAIAMTISPLGMVLAGYAVEWQGASYTLLGIGLCYIFITSIQLFNPILREMEIS